MDKDDKENVPHQKHHGNSVNEQLRLAVEGSEPWIWTDEAHLLFGRILAKVEEGIATVTEEGNFDRDLLFAIVAMIEEFQGKFTGQENR